MSFRKFPLFTLIIFMSLFVVAEMSTALAQAKCSSVLDCAQAAAEAAQLASTQAAQSDAKIAVLEGELDKTKANLDQTNSDIDTLKNRMLFKNEAVRDTCTYSLNNGGNGGSLLQHSPDSRISDVAWCPANFYVAGVVGYRSQAQTWGVVCCPQ